jgi:hypothetical protein
MQRSAVGIAEIADLHNLAAAFHRAARGKRGRGDVEEFRRNLDYELAALRTGLLDGSLSLGYMRRFAIRDPKPRTIHAPCFRERVLHHTVMAHVGPVLDRSLGFDTYACRTGKGALAAVKRARAHLQQYEWYAQIDIRSYFASIDHAVLFALLQRKFKDRGLLALLARIIAMHRDAEGRGLPIGALTSQHFANFYLGGVDRLLVEGCRVRGFVRYMDDLVWWTDDRAAARGALAAARNHLAQTLRLDVKLPVRLGRSRHGISFCGYRILPGRLLLSQRRQHRYRVIRKVAERSWRDGKIDAQGLQSAYSTALALTVHADAAAWRRAELQRRPLEPELLAL